MSRWKAPVIAALAVCGAIVCVPGCRDDLIDATPPAEMPGAVVEDATPPSLADAPAGEAGLDAAEATPDDAGAGDGVGDDAESVEATPQPAPRTTRPRSAPSSSAEKSGEESEAAAEAAPRPRPERSAPRPRGGFEGAAPPGDGGRPSGERRGGTLFERYDANADGLLSRSEIPEAVRERLMAADANGDGALSQEELRSAIPRPEGRPNAQTVSPEERRQRMMERLDANGDGKLQVSELPERMRQGMGQTDTNADGVLSVEEMQQAQEAWRTRRQPPGQRRPAGGD